MKLAVIPEGPLGFDGKEYLYSEGEGLYLDNLAGYFNEVVIYAFAFHRDDKSFGSVSGYKFKASNIRVVELPLKHTHLSKYAQMLSVAKIIAADIKKWDMIYIFLPGYPGALTSLINKMVGKPYFTYLASDWPEEAKLLNPWKGWFGKIVLPIFARSISWLQNTTVKRSLFTLTAGTLLYEKYGQRGYSVYETVPRINWQEFNLYDREDTCQSAVKKLLFVGYLIERKGAGNLLEAFNILIQRSDTEYTLDIVGDGEQRKQLEFISQKLGLQEKVKFHGHIANGPALTDMYRRSDIFIFPSFAGEGFARVLYEAMSQCIPIVASDVCGLGYKMKHEINALLVEPNQPRQIADAVERLLGDGELRRKLISGGYDFMQRLIENSDGGRQVSDLLRKHCKQYRSEAMAEAVV